MCLLYNDAWSAFPGKKHPWALGRPAQEVWEDTWPDMRALFESVFVKGDSTFKEKHPFPADVEALGPERYFTHTSCPIRTEDGSILGVFNALFETTTHLLAERRSRLLLALSNSLLRRSGLDRASREAVRVLASLPEDIPAVALYMREEPAGASVQRLAFAGKHLNASTIDLVAPTLLECDNAGAPVLSSSPLPLYTDSRDAVAGLPVGVRRFRHLPTYGHGGVQSAWGSPVRDVLLLPLQATPPNELPIGYLLCGLNPRLPLDDAYCNFLLAAGTTIAVALGEIMNRGKEEQQAEISRLALETGQFGTWTYDPERRTLDLSGKAAELFRYDGPGGSYSLERAMHHCRPEDQAAMSKAFAEALDQPKELAVEARIPLSEDFERWLWLRGRAYRDTAGRQRLTGLVSDVTEARSAEKLLRETEKLAATGRLAATIAHEINNPLESVTNLVYLAALDQSLSPSTAHLLKAADEELGRVTHIAQQTLGFYRDTQGPVQVDAHQVVLDLVRLFERRPDSRSIRFDTSGVQHVPVVCLQGELRQVLSNLIGNAIQASAPGGHIQVAARLSRNHSTMRPVLRLLIADRGSGIGQEARRKLFTAFFTTKRETGNGLGLWVSKNMLEKQGGTIRFRSRTGLQSGTCFMITLPTEMHRSRLQ